MSVPRAGASPAGREEIAAARRMHELITRSLLVQAVFVASRLRIPDLLAGAPRTAEELAVATGAQPAALHRLLRALTGLEVVTVDGGRFALTPLGRSLCAGPHSAAESAIFLGSPAVWSAWGALGDAVFDGQAAFEHAHGMGLFGYLSAHPDEMAAFQALMSAQSRLQIPAVLAAYDFTQARTIVDVGGGHGAFLARCWPRTPQPAACFSTSRMWLPVLVPSWPRSRRDARWCPVTSSAQSRPGPIPMCSSSSWMTGRRAHPAPCPRRHHPRRAFDHHRDRHAARQ